MYGSDRLREFQNLASGWTDTRIKQHRDAGSDGCPLRVGEKLSLFIGCAVANSPILGRSAECSLVENIQVKLKHERVHSYLR